MKKIFKKNTHSMIHLIIDVKAFTDSKLLMV